MRIHTAISGTGTTLERSGKTMAVKPNDILSIGMLLDTFYIFKKQWLKSY